MCVCTCVDGYNIFFVTKAVGFNIYSLQQIYNRWGIYIGKYNVGRQMILGGECTYDDDDDEDDDQTRELQ